MVSPKRSRGISRPGHKSHHGYLSRWFGLCLGRLPLYRLSSAQPLARRWKVEMLPHHRPSRRLQHPSHLRGTSRQLSAEVAPLRLSLPEQQGGDVLRPRDSCRSLRRPERLFQHPCRSGQQPILQHQLLLRHCRRPERCHLVAHQHWSARHRRPLHHLRLRAEESRLRQDSSRQGASQRRHQPCRLSDGVGIVHLHRCR